jgi:hypothetical protein
VLESGTLPGSGDGTSYLVWGSVELKGTTTAIPGIVQATCTLSLGSATSIDEVKYTVSENSVGIENVYMALSASITTDQQAQISCVTSASSTTTTAETATISAIQFLNGVPTPTPTGGG